MEVRIDRFIEGARRAEGITVIIDVFRAFSLECWMYSFGAKLIRPIGKVEEVFTLREHFPGSVLVGERKGKKLEGFDFGNSPSTPTRSGKSHAGRDGDQRLRSRGGG